MLLRVCVPTYLFLGATAPQKIHTRRSVPFRTIVENRERRLRLRLCVSFPSLGVGFSSFHPHPRAELEELAFRAFLSFRFVSGNIFLWSREYYTTSAPRPLGKRLTLFGSLQLNFGGSRRKVIGGSCNARFSSFRGRYPKIFSSRANGTSSGAAAIVDARESVAWNTHAEEQRGTAQGTAERCVREIRRLGVGRG